jgi:hypothetical protein
MRYKDFERLLERRPFRPFRIAVSTGETFDVLHPETLFLADKFVSVLAPGTNTDSDDVQDFIWIDLIHIVHLQPLRRKPKTT